MKLKYEKFSKLDSMVKKRLQTLIEMMDLLLFYITCCMLRKALFAGASPFERVENAFVQMRVCLLFSVKFLKHP